MARSTDVENGAPSGGDRKAFRHFGDGFAGELVAARLQGYSSGDLAYIDVAVDSSGQLKTVGSGGGASSTVDQGAAGAAAWKVTDTALVALTDGTLRVGGTVAVSIASMPSTPVTGPLTDTQLRASAVPVSLGTLPSLAAGSAVIGHVIVDTAPTTAVTGPLTDTQLRASVVPVSLPAETTKVIGTVNQGTSPWVTSRNWTLASGTDSVSASVSNFPATQPVTGTFWQSTQPVSVASMPTTPVTGTFFQTTQPVSGTVAVSSFQGAHDEMLIELKKHTVQLGLLLAQFNVNEFDLEGLVN